MKRGREYSFNQDLDMMTLVATRGGDFHMARLAERLRCPRCGSRHIRVVWIFPDSMFRQRAVGMFRTGCERKSLI